MRLLYITSERFVNEFIDSIRYSKPGEFRAKYRNVDVLLVDDVQFFGGKGSSQEGFFHTFNALWETHKQLVFSSDRPPKEIPNLEERLTSRFEWGLVTDIQPPDLETRIAILRRKAEVEKMSVPEDVLLFIANKIKSNIRELEGALIRVVAFSSMTGQRISLDLAEDILKALLPARESEIEISIEFIQEVVAKEFNMDKKDMKSKRRTEAIAYPRQIAMYLARSMTEYSLPEIGDAFGGRDHTTVMYAYEKISNKIKSDPFFGALINKIISKIKNKG
jgi:chromosomal replication initiator protein